ncbi:MAG: hypothetical protein AAB339_10775 [Elusimicrobiota bacterium]
MRAIRVSISAAVLWAGFHACWMPQANCEQPKPPCHQDKDSSPAPHSCCGGLHLSAVAEPHGVFSLGSDRTLELVAAPALFACEFCSPGREEPVSDADPPGYGPPALLASPSRSPPAV